MVCFLCTQTVAIFVNLIGFVAIFCVVAWTHLHEGNPNHVNLTPIRYLETSGLLCKPSFVYLNLAFNSLTVVILTAVSGVGSSPALATCETSQVLLAGVSGGFSRGSPVFAPPSDWPVSYELK